jgi:hypothetical protein
MKLFELFPTGFVRFDAGRVTYVTDKNGVVQMVLIV